MTFKFCKDTFSLSQKCIISKNLSLMSLMTYYFALFSDYFIRNVRKSSRRILFLLLLRLLTKIPKYQASIDVLVFFFKKNKPKGKNSVVYISIKSFYTSLNAIVFIFWTQQDSQAYDCTLAFPLYRAYLYP